MSLSGNTRCIPLVLRIPSPIFHCPRQMPGKARPTLHILIKPPVPAPWRDGFPGKCVEERQYDSLRELIDGELAFLDYDQLIY